MSSAPNGNPPVVHPDRRAGGGEGNTLGLVGFVLALVGLVGCCFQPAALLSLAGLVLSIMGLGKRPKGLAIAGVVLGIIGLSGFLIILLTVGVAVLAFIPAMLAVAALAGPEIETGIEEAILHQKVAAYVSETGSYPTDLSQIPDLNEKLKTDHWGTPYKLEVIDPAVDEFLIRSAGEDKVFGTDDDITTDSKRE